MQPLNIAHLYNVCYNLMDNGYNKGVYNMSVLDYPFDSAFFKFQYRYSGLDSFLLVGFIIALERG